VAGIITIAKGHDASYPWKQIGAAEPGKPARNPGKGVGYYLSPAEKGGEPPGTWTGKGVAELGLRPGAFVDRQVFERLYGQHLDPRDPSGETRLGRAPGRYKTAEIIHAQMLDAEPEATAERRAQLLIEAKAQVRTPDLYWDATFSVSKSISLFHASALANAAAAAQRGDLEDVQAWEAVAEGIWDAVMEGNTAALNYLQREAGQTRAGYHPGGRWEDARAWVIASFRQHTSRDGDPQLHVHNLILHKVRRESDGQWRALDSMSLYRHRPAASAIASLAAENALTRRFGVRWVPRADGHGREIAGVRQALMEVFSSRRRSIGPLAARLAQAFEAHFGRAPDARALASLRQWANHATRRGKDSAPLDMAALVRQWSAQARASEAAALEPLAPAVMATGAPPSATAPGDQEDRARARARPLTRAQARRLIDEAAAAVQTAQSTWTEADLIRHLGERLPAHVGAMTAPQAAALLPALARQALARQAVALAAPEWPRVPDCLRRASGESRYFPHGAIRYATSAQLTVEERLLAQARQTGAPRLRVLGSARREIGILDNAGMPVVGDRPIMELLAERVRCGVRARICLTVSNVSGLSRPSASAGNEATTADPRDELAVYVPLHEKERLELRLQRRLFYSSIYRGDDQLLVSQHAYGVAGGETPVLYLQRTEGGDLADAYLDAFKQAWAEAAANGGS
jgi:conjugative relaxase-like TrwC/TraI family protein